MKLTNRWDHVVYRLWSPICDGLLGRFAGGAHHHGLDSVESERCRWCGADILGVLLGCTDEKYAGRDAARQRPEPIMTGLGRVQRRRL